MGKYFLTQCKRLLRYLPGALLVTVLLLAGLMTALTLTTRQAANSEEQQRFPIALSGSTDDMFLQMGLSALESFDSTRFSLQILEMEESEAATALELGQISAYVVVPEGFMDAAFRGQMLPLKFVSTAGASGLVSIFKEEVTKVISTVVLYSQKNVIGMIDAYYDQGIGNQLGSKIDLLSLQYVDYILARDQLYRLEILGVGDRLDLSQYLLCGLTVLLLQLACLPFAPVMIRKDQSLGKMLCAKGRSAWLQGLCDFAVYALSLLLLCAVVLAAVTPFAPKAVPVAALWKGWPVVLLTAAFSFMVYNLCRELISGVLLQFFATVALCFVSGCMYPAFFFPVGLQQLASYLPTGAARSVLAGCLSGETATAATALVLGYSLLFLAMGTFTKVHKIKGVTP